MSNDIQSAIEGAIDVLKTCQVDLTDDVDMNRFKAYLNALSAGQIRWVQAFLYYGRSDVDSLRELYEDFYDEPRETTIRDVTEKRSDVVRRYLEDAVQRLRSAGLDFVSLETW